MLMVRILFYFIFTFLLEITSFCQTWTKIADFPSTERDDGTYFTIGNTTFCGTGLKTGFVLARDMHAFNMTTEVWDTATALPTGMERQYACGFSYNTSGFIFGGIADNNYLNDLWKYDAGTKKWQSLSALPAAGRMGASCFVINDTAYIIGGKTATASSVNEVWAYSILTDKWTSKDNLPFGARWRAAAIASSDKGYLIFGRDASYTYKKELYEYTPVTNSWKLLSSFPGNGRTYAAMKWMNNNLIVIAGIDSLNNSYNDLWKFDLSSMNWKQLSSLPAEARRGGMCFNAANTLYYTTGISQSNNRLKETWKVFDPTSIHEDKLNADVNLYPNPAKDKITVEIKAQGLKFNSIEIMNMMGQTVKTINSILLSNGKTDIDISALPKGIYVMNFLSEKGNIVKKVVKE